MEELLASALGNGEESEAASAVPLAQLTGVQDANSELPPQPTAVPDANSETLAEAEVPPQPTAVPDANSDTLAELPQPTAVDANPEAETKVPPQPTAVPVPPQPSLPLNKEQTALASQPAATLSNAVSEKTQSLKTEHPAQQEHLWQAMKSEIKTKPVKKEPGSHNFIRNFGAPSPEQPELFTSKAQE